MGEMEKGNKESRIIRSMEDFKKEYFPEASEKEKEGLPADAHSIGLSYAKESLERIKKQLGE